MRSNRKAEVGDRVAVTHDIDLEPYATIRRGETGSVVSIDRDGNIDIEMDNIHPGLAQYHNCIWVCGHGGTDEVRDALLLTAKSKEAKERACKILLQSCSPQRALHSTATASLLSLLSAMSA